MILHKRWEAINGVEAIMLSFAMTTDTHWSQNQKEKKRNEKNDIDLGVKE